MDVRIKRNNVFAKLPVKGTDGSAGFDLCAAIPIPMIIRPGESVMIPSGLSMEIEKGYGGFIYARSGLSTRNGVRPSTCVSVIDSDYRGEVGLPMYNDSEHDFVVQPGMRICQIVFAKVEDAVISEMGDLGETERGNGGFGSTGGV